MTRIWVSRLLEIAVCCANEGSIVFRLIIVISPKMEVESSNVQEAQLILTWAL